MGLQFTVPISNMSMLNVSHCRPTTTTPAGLVYSVDFMREDPIYYPGEIVGGRILFSTVTRAPLPGRISNDI